MPDKKNTDKNVAFYAKNMAIKPDAELTELITGFMAEFGPDSAPQNIKQLLLAALSRLKTSVSKQDLETLMDNNRQAALLHEETLEKWRVDAQAKEEAHAAELERLNELLQAKSNEVDPLNQEITRLTDANKELSEKISQLVGVAEELQKQVDYLSTNESNELLELKKLLADAQTKFANYKLTAPVLADNEAVISFAPQDLENLRLTRQVLYAMGSNPGEDPNNVIKMALLHYLQTVSNLSAIGEAYQPVIPILKSNT